MLNLNFDTFPVLQTERLKLRQLEKTDLPEMFALRSDPRVTKYTGRPTAKSMEEVAEFMETIMAKNDGSILWAIISKDSSKLIGTICLWNIVKDHYRAEIGFMLLPEYHGMGLMPEAVVKVLEYGFNTMNLHSVAARVSPENIASIKVLERNKFLKEGYFKEDSFFNGKFCDTVVYSLLAD